jgi:hypothetical protein
MILSFSPVYPISAQDPAGSRKDHNSARGWGWARDRVRAGVDHQRATGLRIRATVSGVEAVRAVMLAVGEAGMVDLGETGEKIEGAVDGNLRGMKGGVGDLEAGKKEGDTMRIGEAVNRLGGLKGGMGKDTRMKGGIGMMREGTMIGNGLEVLMVGQKDVRGMIDIVGIRKEIGMGEGATIGGEEMRGIKKGIEVGTGRETEIGGRVIAASHSMSSMFITQQGQLRISLVKR